MTSIISIEYTSHQTPIADFIFAVKDSKLKHYASDLFPELEMIDEELFNYSLQRAQKVCATMNLPIHEHFKKVYRTSENNIYCDYKLSHIAYLLVSINGDVSSRKVAEIQMRLVNTLVNR